MNDSTKEAAIQQILERINYLEQRQRSLESNLAVVILVLRRLVPRGEIHQDITDVPSE